MGFQSAQLLPVTSRYNLAYVRRCPLRPVVRPLSALELIGLVLAGGESRRMGEDKGALELEGRRLVERCVGVLEPLCGEVLVSVTPAQAETAPYREFALVLDDGSVRGPAAGLLAAWDRRPDSALLVWAVDMPLVDAGLLEALIARRHSDKVATAYRNAEGLIEPLCAIWEPRAAGMLREAARDRSPSLRRLLENADIALVAADRPEKLTSLNTPEAFAAAKAEIPPR